MSDPVTLRSTTCAASGHPEFTLTLRRELPAPGLEGMLLAYFEHRVRRGVRFAPGQVAVFGGATLRVCARPDGTLGVEELVPGPEPRWREGVDGALWTTWVQNEVVRSVQLEHDLSFARDVSTAVVCTHLLNAPGVFLHRSAPTGDDDSGWFAGCLDPRHAHSEVPNLEGMVLSHLAAVCAPVVPFLALPVGSSVVVHGPGRVKAEVAFQGQQLIPLPGSYLDVLNRGAN